MFANVWPMMQSRVGVREGGCLMLRGSGRECQRASYKPAQQAAYLPRRRRTRQKKLAGARVAMSSSLPPPPRVAAYDDLRYVLGDIVSTSGDVGANPLEDQVHKGSSTQRVSHAAGRIDRASKGAHLDPIGAPEWDGAQHETGEFPATGYCSMPLLDSTTGAQGVPVPVPHATPDQVCTPHIEAEAL